MIFSKRFIQPKTNFMETMINLTDLLKHEILDLYSVEEQIIDALPKMVEKAKNPGLKKALRDHLKVTEEHKRRLDKVKQTFGEENQNGNKGFFSRLFGGGSGGEKCKGMAGIISESEKMMNADITDEVLDAAIISAAQKVEHYEICGYGTARAYARELKMADVEQMFTQTLNEEYAADDLLTSLAVGKLNIKAEQANGMSEGGRSAGMRMSGKEDSSSNKGRSNGTSSKDGSTKSAVKSSGDNSSKGAGKSSGIRSSSKSASKSLSTSNALKGGTKSSTSNASKGGTKSSGNNASKGGTKILSRGASSKGGTKSSGRSSKNVPSKVSKGGTNGAPKSKRATSGSLRER